MKTINVKKSTALICSALLSSIVPVAEPAFADPGQITVNGQWNNGAGGVYTAISGVHTYGGPATVLPGSIYPQFTVSVTSGPSLRPGWEHELTLDFANFGLFNNPPNIWWDTQLGIKPPGTNNPIVAFEVKNGAGMVLNTVNLGSDGGTIRIRNLIADFNLAGAANDKLIIQWNQIPGPGGLALLGLAAGFSRRRRRN